MTRLTRAADLKSKAPDKPSQSKPTGPKVRSPEGDAPVQLDSDAESELNGAELEGSLKKAPDKLNLMASALDQKFKEFEAKLAQQQKPPPSAPQRRRQKSPPLSLYHLRMSLKVIAKMRFGQPAHIQPQLFYAQAHAH